MSVRVTNMMSFANFDVYYIKCLRSAKGESSFFSKGSSYGHYDVPVLAAIVTYLQQMVTQRVSKPLRKP